MRISPSGMLSSFAVEVTACQPADVASGNMVCRSDPWSCLAPLQGLPPRRQASLRKMETLTGHDFMKLTPAMHSLATLTPIPLLFLCFKAEKACCMSKIGILVSCQYSTRIHSRPLLSTTQGPGYIYGGCCRMYSSVLVARRAFSTRESHWGQCRYPNCACSLCCRQV